jgi:hypothetical protein
MIEKGERECDEARLDARFADLRIIMLFEVRQTLEVTATAVRRTGAILALSTHFIRKRENMVCSRVE